MRTLVGLFAFLWLCGCSRTGRLAASIDATSFENLGGTIFTSPGQVSIKQIHLDHGSLVDKRVIVDGTVKEQSRHGTYLVLEDNTARMLVVLTDLGDRGPIAGHLRVLGTVKIGKLGLPYLLAHAVEPMAKS